jgi:ATP-dependent DNA helicase RecQ
MGFDKSDLGFVVHLGAPPSPIAYYQQIGRAGRAIDDAIVVLLPSDQDLRIWNYFALLAFPPEDQVRVVLKSLTAADRPLSTQVLETRVDLSRGQLEHMLKVLDVDGAVRRVEGGWTSTGMPWQHDTARYERVSSARAAEQDAMLKYIALEGCRLRFLRECLDDPAATACGRCDNCTGTFLSGDVPISVIEALGEFLGRVGIEISPRALWPTGLPGIGIPLSGRIAASDCCLVGRTIARLSDMGWGEELSALFADATEGTPVPSQMLDLAHRVASDSMQSTAAEFCGIVGIQSRRRPTLANSLLDGLAARTRLPVLGTLLADDSGAGTGKSNNARRVAALHKGFVVSAELEAACRATESAILLVDDFVDSGWTMTLAGRALRRAGATDVVPFALATTGRRD